MPNVSSLTFQKRLSLKTSSHSRYNLLFSRQCSLLPPSSTPSETARKKPFSLHYNKTRLSPSTKRLVQKWFQLEHNKYISTYKYTKQVRPPHPLHELPGDFFFPLSCFSFFFFFNTAQHGNFFWITCSELEHQI